VAQVLSDRGMVSDVFCLLSALSSLLSAVHCLLSSVCYLLSAVSSLLEIAQARGYVKVAQVLSDRGMLFDVCCVLPLSHVCCLLF
jgi:hypothetical protein